MLCAAPTVLISIANAPAEMRAGAPRGVRLFTAGAPPAAATIEQAASGIIALKRGNARGSGVE
jgi:hypothetical protein